MKKTVALILLLSAMGYGYVRLKNWGGIDFASLRGEVKTVGRGDLTIPINATGEVSPLAHHQVKSEASGEVVEITREPGELIKKGELLIRLDREDEQRSVKRAEADVTRTKANLESAKIRQHQRETAGIDQANAQIAQLDAKLALSKFNYDKVAALKKENRASPDEWERVRTSYAELLASLDRAKADLADAKIAVKLAEQDVVLTQAAYDQAVTALSDAEDRLSETEVLSPVDGIVTQILAQEGSVIQGGMSTFGAGTVLAIIADTSKLYVHAEVDEAEIGAVRELAPEWAQPGHEPEGNKPIPISSGTTVKIHVDSFREDEFEGVIERIHPEPLSRASSVVTYQVDILLTSENREKLLLGMQADVEFTAQSALNVILVPHEAIRRDNDRLGVYIPVDEPNNPRRGKLFKPCRFGLDNGAYAEVIEGLTEGAEVYIKLPQLTEREQRLAND